MDFKVLMSMIDIESILTQFPNSLIVKNYVMNVNMTQIECNPTNVTNNESIIYDCPLDQFQNMGDFITTAVDEKSVSFY